MPATDPTPAGITAVAPPAVTPAPTKKPAAFPLEPPRENELWSAWYVEADDTFAEFASHEPVPAPGGTPTRQLSSRQMSGQFEDDVAKSWEEDWEDEDVDDTYDAIMAKIAREQKS